MKRERLGEIATIRLAVKDISLGKGQCWYRTEKAYEIWQEKPILCRITRIPRSRVIWVFEK